MFDVHKMIWNNCKNPRIVPHSPGDHIWFRAKSNKMCRFPRGSQTVWWEKWNQPTIRKSFGHLMLSLEWKIFRFDFLGYDVKNHRNKISLSSGVYWRCDAISGVKDIWVRSPGLWCKKPHKQKKWRKTTIKKNKYSTCKCWLKKDTENILRSPGLWGKKTQDFFRLSNTSKTFDAQGIQINEKLVKQNSLPHVNGGNIFTDMFLALPSGG